MAFVTISTPLPLSSRSTSPTSELSHPLSILGSISRRVTFLPAVASMRETSTPM